MRSKWQTELSVDQILQLSFVTNTSVTAVPTIDGKSEYLGDPTEIALREYSDSKENIEQFDVELVDEKPFSSETRTRSVTVSIGGKVFTCVNGAPESVLEGSTLSEEEISEIHAELQKCASKGLRTIAFGVSVGEESVEFIGFVSLKDPLRPGIRAAITDAREMGIRTILITGDNPLTAEAIAVEAGITPGTGSYMIGSMLDSMSDEQLMETLDTVNVFARISPIQKLRLVTLLQRKGEIVAMTGDGVNDAPALKQADIGVAMGKVGTDVAKEAADAVVTDDNYVTMIDGIKEGRAIVRRIELATMFFVAGNLGEFVYILIALLLNLPLISPLQILFINLITDALPALALAVAPVRVLGKKNIKTTLLGKAEYIYVGIGASILATSTIFATWHTKEDPEVAKTVAFVMLMMLQQIMLIDVWLGLVRHTSELKKIFNVYLLGGISTTVLMIVFLFNTPFFVDLFDLVKTPTSTYVYFLYGVVIYMAYVLTRVHKLK
jgi:Ca2+-transporting ATPase